MDGEQLILFGINPAHNLIHIVLGVTYLIGARATEAGARAVPKPRVPATAERSLAP